jgi:ABC-type amino acid transport substrate-binding protein
MNAAFKKLAVAVALASLVATGSLAAATPAAAGWGWRHGGGRGYHSGGWGVPVAAGLRGAIAVGAIASAASQPAYYDGPCYLANRPVADAWGDVVGYRRAQVCE